MRLKHRAGLSLHAALATLSLVLFAAAAQAQWLNYRTPGVPRTPQGKPILTAPVPKAADGKPDRSGVWIHEKTPVAEMKRLFGPAADAFSAVEVPGMELETVHKYAIDVLADYKPEEMLLRPEALDRTRRNAAQIRGTCSVDGLSAPPFPFVGLLAEPIKIVQGRQLTMVLYENGNLFRQLYTDGRQLPKDFDLPAFNGYSAGRWEGDTLVVETAGFNDRTFLDLAGHPHSEDLHMTEHFRRRDFGHLDYEITFDDPKMYTKPFTIKIPHELLADSDIFEMYTENEKDCKHIGKQ